LTAGRLRRHRKDLIWIKSCNAEKRNLAPLIRSCARAHRNAAPHPKTMAWRWTLRPGR